jgi:sortase (surface protein transpeptidase)
VSPYQFVVVEDPQPAILARIFESSRAEAATYVSPSLAELGGVGLGPATRIRIPVLNIDTAVKELAVIRTADSSAWETPKHIVGHIPTTPVPGSDGQGWYFGHLESPIRGEGNVFQRLPEIVKLLERDDSLPIYIFLESEDRKFVYQVYRTEGMPQEELRISDSGIDDITLVTCTPRFVYDQRLLVTAALVGVLDT